MLERRALGRVQDVAVVVNDGTDLDRPLFGEPVALLFGKLPGQTLAALRFAFEAFRRGYDRHRDLMLEPLLCNLKRDRHVEDLLAVLDGNDAAGGEALAVAGAVDLV